MEQELESNASSIIDALVSLARNSRLSGRGDICAGLIAILIRISCFSRATMETPRMTLDTDIRSAEKKKKKKKKEQKDQLSISVTFVDFPDSTVEEIVDFVHLVEKAAPFSEKLVQSSTQRLLTMLADFGSLAIEQANTPIEVNSSRKGKAPKRDSSGRSGETFGETATVMDLAMAFLSHLLKSGMELDKDLGIEEELQPYPILEDLSTVLKLRDLTKSTHGTMIAKTASGSKEDSVDIKYMRLGSTLYPLLVHATFQVSFTPGHILMNGIGWRRMSRELNCLNCDLITPSPCM